MQAESKASPTWMTVITDWLMRALAVVLIGAAELRYVAAADDQRIADETRFELDKTDPPQPASPRELQFAHWATSGRSDAFLLVAAAALCFKSSLRRSRDA